MASLVERSLVKKHGTESKRTGERKETCYDFDGVMGAAGQGRMMEEGGIDMKNKHKEMKIQNTKHQESKLPQMGTPTNQRLSENCSETINYIMSKLTTAIKTFKDTSIL